ncbi:MAG: hypothetical protein HY351_04870, partial [Candidatus Omnitrophica bacterium]|nr:hypothetical protein [Candidatus Omnitrophota bacterium]
MKTYLKNEKGVILIWFYLLVVMLIITSGSLFALSFQESQLTAIDQSRNKAFYLAEAGIDWKLKELRSGTTPATPSFAEGNFSVSYCQSTASGTTPAPAAPCAYDQPDMIISSGTVSGITKTIVAVILKQKPPGAKAGITSEGNMSFNGNIAVDGRDHDANGNLTGDPGTYGASSGGIVTQSGSSDIGGNGFVPTSPANPASIQQNADNPFTTPEELLGLEAGSLDQYKTSTPPSEMPFNGIVYYTGDSWIAPDFGTDADPSTGILIVHNAAGNALLKNVHGTFKGII